MFLAELLEEPVQGVTLLYGPATGGKTTACLQALTGRSVYVTTNKNFSPERLKSMRADAPHVLSRLILYEPQDLDSFEKAVSHAVTLSAVAQLIVIDSLATHIRQADRKSGNLALHRILQALQKSACPVLLTSEVYEKLKGEPDSPFVGGDMLRLAARTIVELKDGVATVKKHPLHAGRQWYYRLVNEGIAKV